jgi:tetratricopeptide (TPR) repeat protein
MRAWSVSALLAISLAGSLAASEAAFERGMKALAAKEYDAALSLLEDALMADPDNLRFASEYRQAVLARAKALHPKEGQPADFDRSVNFFEKLTAKNPTAANAFLNYGFSYVDKIPAAGSITQVILAQSALTHFTKSIDTRPSWIAYYTRGNSYLYWPKIFGRAKLGIADLEEAMKMQKGGKKPYHVRVYISLGDGYWKMDNIEKARAVWTEGAKEFPDNKALKDRLARQGDELKAYIDDVLDPNKRVDTDLRELWLNP